MYCGYFSAVSTPDTAQHCTLFEKQILYPGTDKIGNNFFVVVDPKHESIGLKQINYVEIGLK